MAHAAAGEICAPGSAEAAAGVLAGCARESRPVRILGGGTKATWGGEVKDPAVQLRTTAMDAIVEHSEGDFTAVVGAGLPLARAQEAFARAGQMLALDPPAPEGTTIGGVVATADSGPLRHRYGPPRDLVIGITVALADGTVARAGGRVIKNVAGYDLSKLMSGAFGTLGVITQVSLRLHPRPRATATAVLTSGEPETLAELAAELAHRPLELDSLDVRYQGGEGAILARFAGATAGERAAALAGAEVVEDDDSLWADQRAGQRSSADTVVRVSGLPTELAEVLRAADVTGARVVGRAGVGLCYLTLPGAAVDAVERLRADLAPAACVVLDAPPALRAAGLDPWDARDSPELGLARRVKERFDPAGICNPGVFYGGI